MKKPLLEFTDKGIYCSRANVYIDPWKPVQNALISHGHADHSRAGSKKYITHHRNLPIIRHRLGNIQASGVEWGETFKRNGVTLSFHPAGHIIGSSQIRVEFRGEVWVFSGDYKTENDGVCEPFEPVRCHSFITECTFGLPAFSWQPQQRVLDDIIKWHAANKVTGKTSVLFAYSLGKAQRLLAGLGPDYETVFTHGAIENMTEVLRPMGKFAPTRRITRETTSDELRGRLVYCPAQCPRQYLDA